MLVSKIDEFHTVKLASASRPEIAMPALLPQIGDGVHIEEAGEASDEDWLLEKNGSTFPSDESFGFK